MVAPSGQGQLLARWWKPPEEGQSEAGPACQKPAPGNFYLYLVYYDTELITAVKSLIALAPRWK
jgi:hypothetical protein